MNTPFLYVTLVPLLLSLSLSAQPLMSPLKSPQSVPADERVENFTGKTVLVFTPHPDDETFSMGGTLARLTSTGNTVHIAIYTNDNKGSLDPEMTRERLAAIRRAEEEKSSAILGIPASNIHWLGYEDGDLEYAEPRILRGEAARLIKRYRPDAVFAPDPGSTSVQWHKTDHRMAASITTDALLAAEWHLYYPHHRLDEKLEPFHVKQVYYFYAQEPDYEVDLKPFLEVKIKAAQAHVSQFEPSLSRYSSLLDPKTAAAIKERFAALHGCPSGPCAERFRRVEN